MIKRFHRRHDVAAKRSGILLGFQSHQVARKGPLLNREPLDHAMDSGWRVFSEWGNARVCRRSVNFRGVRRQHNRKLRSRHHPMP